MLAQPASGPPDAAALIAHLARPAPAHTSYTEVRFVHVLRAPLVLHGELEYLGQDHLSKRVDTPYRETSTIADGAVEVAREGRETRRFTLDRAPELKAMLASFGALLGGDIAVLEQVFSIALAQRGADWTLKLTPHDAEVARHLREVDVDGSAGEPRCFTLTEGGGDGSVMLLGGAAAQKLPDPLTPAALATLCGRVQR